MKRALIARELGDGYGHYPALAFVAERLRERDWVTALATPNPADAGSGIEHGLWEIYPAPVVRERQRLAPAVLYSDLLIRAGYDDLSTLTEMVDGWIALLRATKTRLVFAEHAPAAVLAAHIQGVPALTMGTGFVCPPAQHRLTVLREVSPESHEEASRRAHRLLSTVRALLVNAGAEPLAQIGDLFTNESLLFTFPELDPYLSARGAASYLGIPGPTRTRHRASATPQWPTDGIGRLFGYFRADWPGLAVFADSLAESGHACLLHVPGISSQLQDRIASARVAVTREPLELSAELATCDVIACHGGHGLTATALLAGCPVVIAPTHLEQRLTAERVVNMGAGLAVHMEQGRDAYASALDAILNNGSYTERACAFAESHTVTKVEAVDARLDPVLRSAG